jgi:hypothetical protein
MAIADAMIELFVMTSCLARAGQRAGQAAGTLSGDMTALYLHDALARVGRAAEDVMAAVCAGRAAHAATAAVRALAARAPRDVVALRARIARRLVAAGTFDVRTSQVEL